MADKMIVDDKATTSRSALKKARIARPDQIVRISDMVTYVLEPTFHESDDTPDDYMEMSQRRGPQFKKVKNMRMVQVDPQPVPEVNDDVDIVEASRYTLKTNVSLSTKEREQELTTFGKQCLLTIRKHVHGVNWKPEFELSNAQDPKSQKFITVNLMLKMHQREETAPEAFGVYPVAITYYLRKGLERSNNSSVLSLAPKGFKRLVDLGGPLADRVLDAVKVDYENEAALPKFSPIVLEKRNTKGKDGKDTISQVLLGVSYLPGRDAYQKAPVMNIREFYTDATGNLKAGSKGMSMGLRGFLCLIRPVNEVINLLHDTLGQFRASLDEFEANIDEQLQVLAQQQDSMDDKDMVDDFDEENVSVIEEDDEDDLFV